MKKYWQFSFTGKCALFLSSRAVHSCTFWDPALGLLFSRMGFSITFSFVFISKDRFLSCKIHKHTDTWNIWLTWLVHEFAKKKVLNEQFSKSKEIPASFTHLNAVSKCFCSAEERKVRVWNILRVRKWYVSLNQVLTQLFHRK